MRKDPRESVLWEKAYGKWRDAHGAKGEAWDSPDFHHFLWEVQDKAEAEQITFLRKLGVKALLTDLNAWTEEAGTQACRSRFDYVDDHFYWDHPHFLEKDWSLPSRGGSGGGSSIPGGGEVSGRALTRLQGKPYTITEFNYASPNPFRAEGGLLTGAFAALQDWGGLWRFDYSGARDGIATPQRMEYFDVVRDPLRQASDYAAMALFSRGDATSAPHGIALTGTLQDYWNQAPEALSAGFPLLAWCVKLATKVGGAADPAWLEIPFSQRNTETDKALEKLRAKGGPLQLGGTDLSQGIFESETGEARLETKSGVFSVNTQRTAGLAGPEGTERTLGPLTLSLTKSWGTVFAVSLDRLPLAESRRILVAHLTDLKNTGMVFRGMDMQVLEKVGSLPYLVKAGSAEVKMKKSGVKGARVYRLDTTGKRVAEAPSRFKGGVLEFTASTATQPDATFYYEIVAEP